MKTIQLAVPFMGLLTIALSGCVVSRPTLHAENQVGQQETIFSPQETPQLVLEGVAEKTNCMVVILSLPTRTRVRTLYRSSGAEGAAPAFTQSPPLAFNHRLVISGLADLPQGSYLAQLWVAEKCQDTLEFSVNGNWSSRSPKT